MKKALIIGASILQMPAILKARELGYSVGVIDYNPEAMGIPYADEFFNVSTTDVEGVVRTAKSFKPDVIFTLATDRPMRAVAAACEALGLPGISPETARKATDKAAMIKAFEEHGVEHPWYFVLREPEGFRYLTDSISYPCVVKPTDNAGSRGVALCRNEAELLAGYAYARRESYCGEVILEEYLEGPEFSVEVMVVDGEPIVLQITDKLTTGAPHFVEMGHSQPTRQPKEIQERIKDLAVRACRAVGIHVGPAHVELILTKKGPVMVELGARMGGDCITTHLVPLSTGIDMVGAAIKLANGMHPDLTPKQNRGSAIRYFRTAPGILRSIEGVEKAKTVPGVKEISFVYKIGDEIREVDSSTDRIGFVIAEAATAQEAIEVCERAMGMITVHVE